MQDVSAAFLGTVNLSSMLSETASDLTGGKEKDKTKGMTRQSTTGKRMIKSGRQGKDRDMAVYQSSWQFKAGRGRGRI